MNIETTSTNTVLFLFPVAEKQDLSLEIKLHWKKKKEILTIKKKYLIGLFLIMIVEIIYYSALRKNIPDCFIRERRKSHHLNSLLCQ